VRVCIEGPLCSFPLLPTPPHSLLLQLLWLAEILFCKLRKFQLLQTSLSFSLLSANPLCTVSTP